MTTSNSIKVKANALRLLESVVILGISYSSRSGLKEPLAGERVSRSDALRLDPPSHRGRETPATDVMDLEKWGLGGGGTAAGRKEKIAFRREWNGSFRDFENPFQPREIRVTVADHFQMPGGQQCQETRVILVIGVIVKSEVQVLVGTQEREPGEQDDYGETGPSPLRAFNEIGTLCFHGLQTEHTTEAAATELYRQLSQTAHGPSVLRAGCQVRITGWTFRLLECLLAVQTGVKGDREPGRIGWRRAVSARSDGVVDRNLGR